MALEIEARGVRWRSVGRVLSVATVAERRRQVAAQATLPAGQTLRPVLQARIHQRPSVAVHDESTGPDDSNLRPRSTEEGSVLVAKD
jgi:hypothetical protein